MRDMIVVCAISEYVRELEIGMAKKNYLWVSEPSVRFLSDRF